MRRKRIKDDKQNGNDFTISGNFKTLSFEYLKKVKLYLIFGEDDLSLTKKSFGKYWVL